MAAARAGFAILGVGDGLGCSAPSSFIASLIDPIATNLEAQTTLQTIPKFRQAPPRSQTRYGEWSWREVSDIRRRSRDQFGTGLKTPT
jgi:hypothetical protein